MMTPLPPEPDVPPETVRTVIFDPIAYFGDFFQWIQDRSVVLSCSMLVISILYAGRITQAKDIPLSLTSPNVVASLPIVFLTITLVVFTILLTSLLPAIFVFLPEIGTGKSPLWEFLASKKEIKPYHWIGKNPGIKLIASINLIAIALPSAIIAMMPSSDIIFIYIATISALAAVLQVKIRAGNLGRNSRGAKPALFFIYYLTFNAFIIIFISTILHTILTHPSIAKAAFFIMLAISLVTAGVIQMLFINSFSNAEIRPPPPLKHIASLTIFTIGILGLPDSTGIAIAKTAAIKMTPFSSTCTAIFLTAEGAAKIPATLITDNKNNRHLELEVLPYSGDTLMVRPKQSGEKTTFFIPGSHIESLSPCSTSLEQQQSN